MTNKIFFMDLSKSEEDYLKALFHLIIEQQHERAGTNQLAEYLDLSPASVSGMLKKLRGKELVSYEKYGKLKLTEQGEAVAVQLIRKHRLWETFLCGHLNFSWDEVHPVAEQLEHINSAKLVRELDSFLGYPKADPHGAVIPNEQGEYKIARRRSLADLDPGKLCRLISVKDSSVAFLQYVTRIGLELSDQIRIVDKQEYDGSMTIAFGGKEVNVSRKFAENLLIDEL